MQTGTGNYSINSDGTGTMNEVGSSQSQTLLLAATSGGISQTALVTSTQTNGKAIGTGFLVRALSVLIP